MRPKPMGKLLRVLGFTDWRWLIPAVSLAPVACDSGSAAAEFSHSFPVADWLSECSTGPSRAQECVALLYIWSPSMPLSEKGLPEARAAAVDLGLQLFAVSAQELFMSAPAAIPHVKSSHAYDLFQAVLASGAKDHAPALLVLVPGRVVGPAIMGYRTSQAYQDYIAERLKSGRATSPPPYAGTVPHDTIRPITIRQHELAEKPGAFFRLVPRTTYIAYTTGSEAKLLDLTTGEVLPAPGEIDFVPSPDGRIFVSPRRGGSGLMFFDAAEVLNPGNNASLPDPIYTDLEMRDQYPTIGILEADNESTTYRVAMSWHTSVAIKDYVIKWEDGAPKVRPMSPSRAACPSLLLSLPMLSPDGRLMAARDQATGTTVVARLTPQGHCEIQRNIGLATSKASFSQDGKYVTFSAVLSDVEPKSSLFLYDTATGKLGRIMSTESSHLTIPDISSRGKEMIFLRKTDAGKFMLELLRVP